MTNTWPIAGLSVHPAKAWWSFVRPVIVMVPVYSAGAFSSQTTAMFAALGLILLLSPLGMPAPKPLHRTYPLSEALGARLSAAFNSLIATGLLSGVFFLVRKLTGHAVRFDWMFVRFSLFPNVPAEVHSEEIAAAAWLVAIFMVFIKSCVWTKAVITQGLDGFGYGPSAHIPIKTDIAHMNSLKSVVWFAAGMIVGWLALCFIYNYSALLVGYLDWGGERTVGILMLIGFLTGHTF